MGESPARAAQIEAPGLPSPGEILDGKYRLLRIVGEGGMGVVYEAIHVKLGQRVAVKVLQPEILQSPDLVERFEREARAAGRLRGRNVARVIDVEASPGKLPHIVMEFLEGHDLELEICRYADRRVPLHDAIDVVLQACRAIGEAHAAGIVHRDLKPSNLFLCDEAGERVVKLLDFGVSKMEDEASRLTSTQLVMGTVYYMSPEQVRSAKSVDARTDIWALSVILYELLSGTPPFVGSTTSVAVAIANDEPPPLSSFREVPPGLEAVIQRGMAKRPGDRYPDVLAFASAIAPFGAPSSMRRLSIEPSSPVVVVTRDSSGPATGTARTVHNGSGATSGPLLPVVAPGARDAATRVSRTKLASRSIAAVAGVALVVAIGFVAASRATTVPAPPLAIDRESKVALAPPAPSTPAPSAAPDLSATAPVASSALLAIEPTPPAVPPAPTPHGRARPTPPKPVHAPNAPPTAPAATPKKEKPPLVAPF